MFTEGVKIKPEVDAKAAKKMENTLSRRFMNATKKMEKGLKDGLKLGGLGGIATMIAGFGSKLLSPIDQLEERINQLMDTAKGLSTTADKFNTSAGKIRKLQELAGVSGLTPDELEGMLTSFKTNQKKLGSDFQDKDTAEAFFQFVQALRYKGIEDKKRLADMKKKGVSNEDLIKERDKVETERKKIETLAFGEELYGPSKNFVEQNQASVKRELNTPSAQKVNIATEKANKLAYKDRLQNIQRESKSYVDRGMANSNKLITEIQKRRDAEEENMRKQEANIGNLSALLEVSTKSQSILTDIQVNTAKTFQLFGDSYNWIKKKFGIGQGDNKK